MLRPTRAALIALPLFALVAGCSSGEQSQGEVRDDIQQNLLSPDRDEEAPEVSEDEASEIADCVASGLFESGDFTEDERNEATHADDGDIDPDLQAKVVALYDSCGLPEG